MRKWHIFFPFVPKIAYIINVPKISFLMRLQHGQTVVDYYPTKSWIDDVINPDKFLKVVTYNGKTVVKDVMPKAKMIRQINNHLARKWKAISNNNLPQYVRS